MRPLRGGQGTFDKIIQNIRQVAGKCRISIGGNFDESTVDSYPALLDFLREQEFADKLVQGRVQADHPRAEAAAAERPDPADRRRRRGQAAERHVHDVGGRGRRASATAATSSTRRCRSCAKRRRSAGSRPSTACTWGPCEIHKRHAHTIGPDGALYACPGFAGDAQQSTGHIDGRQDSRRAAAATRFEAIARVEGMRRLRVHPGLRGRLHGGRAHRARRHEQAELPQDRASRPGLISLARDAARAREPG